MNPAAVEGNSRVQRGDSVPHKQIGSQAFSPQIGPLFFLTGIFTLNFLSRIVFAPLMPVIERDLGVTHGEAGSFFLLISLGYFIMLLGSGFVSSRINHRRTIIASAAAVGAAMLFVAMSRSLWGILTGVLLLGMAAGLYLPSGMATLTALVSPRHWGKAIGIHELAPNLGFVTAPLISEAVFMWSSWRSVLILLGVASLIMAVAFARFGKGGRFPGSAPSLEAFKILFPDRSFWVVMGLFSLAIGGSLGVYTMLPIYMVSESGMDRNWANTLIALSRISGLGAVFLSGWISDRLGPRRTMGIFLLLTGLTTVLMGIGPDSWTVVMVFVQPIMAVCFFPPGFAALSSVGPPSTRNIAVSLTVPVAFLLGGGAIPTGIGVMGDAVSVGFGIAWVGGLIGCGFFLSLCLKESEPPHK